MSTESSAPAVYRMTDSPDALRVARANVGNEHMTAPVYVARLLESHDHLMGEYTRVLRQNDAYQTENAGLRRRLMHLELLPGAKLVSP